MLLLKKTNKKIYKTLINFFKCKTRHYITTEKKSGVISGKQRSEGGDIEWSTELPRTCSLSAYVWPIPVIKVSINELHIHKTVIWALPFSSCL